jgi:hypothetical protein
LIFLLILPLCSIYRHGGHDGWSAGSSDKNFKGNHLRMIQAKFGLNWPSGFREDFLKSLQTDDGRQVMTIAHTGELKIKDQTIEINKMNQSSFNICIQHWQYLPIIPYLTREIINCLCMSPCSAVRSQTFFVKFLYFLHTTFNHF